jgi:transposase
MEGKEELKETLLLCVMLAEENPCSMKDISLSAIAKALRLMVGKEYTRGMNQRALGKYYKVDARTLQRWAHKYPDFPKGTHGGDKEVRYEPMEVMAFKKSHPELWKTRTE